MLKLFSKHRKTISSFFVFTQNRLSQRSHPCITRRTYFPVEQGKILLLKDRLTDSHFATSSEKTKNVRWSGMAAEKEAVLGGDGFFNDVG